MGASAQAISALIPEVDPGIVREHLSRLDSRYVERFGAGEIAAHIRALSRLSSDHPVEVILRAADAFSVIADGGLACTVLAFDYPSEFSFISGVLASMGFDVLSGEVFTYAPPAPGGKNAGRRKIIDCFEGRVRQESQVEGWAGTLLRRLEQVMRILESGGRDSLRRTKLAVNEMAALALQEIGSPAAGPLYPVSIETDNSGPLTRMRVVSRDTPFFLFAFSAALSLQGVSIEHVTIRTEGGRIEDSFEFADSGGGRIEEASRLDGIKLSVLLTKQFTSFLQGAGDPRAALLRFENLVLEILEAPGRGKWVELLSNQRVMADLARLLGASTFLWEDFVRLQYETLIPMLSSGGEERSFCEPLESLSARLEAALAGAEDEETFALALNGFKDREIFLFDLEHILGRDSGLLALSARLTALAELVVDAAASFAYRALALELGEPRTVAGLSTRYAILGLGKLGGAALGYASDIELLFVYADSGFTDGPRKVENSEFFGLLVRKTQGLVRAKREGIFRVDLRLRPYGDSGPLACSLETFCTYYASTGPSHSYERLALVRLRAIGGDRGLGGQLERLRDELVYSARSIDVDELRDLRERQLREKSRPGLLNAKFSPGALVDLEYAVQILQVMHGAADARLKTPRIHEALAALATAGIVEEAEANELVGAYHFFRRLVNGLRMLRGSALDLFLPAVEAEEYSHLARRIGYGAEARLAPERALKLDFEIRSAQVRAFADAHFGPGGLGGGPQEMSHGARDPMATAYAPNVADLILSDAIADETRDAVLGAKGFRNPARALVNLRGLSGADGPDRLERKSNFARLAILACDILSRLPDPDSALNNWERFVASLDDPSAHLSGMLSQPRRLEILLDLFSSSQFLADTLVRDPALLDYITREEILRAAREESDLAAELETLSSRNPSEEAWRDAVRVFRRKEILRLGARDAYLGVSARSLMREISSLADSVVEAAVTRMGKCCDGSGFCVLAFGKLGGRELNFSSDIDLLGIWEAEEGSSFESVISAEAEATAVMARLRAELSEYTAQGYAYRVDLRLRPYGGSGQLVSQAGALLDYYEKSAALWELQALLKARAVAGDLALGRRFLGAASLFLRERREKTEVIASIATLRGEAVRKMSRATAGTADVKQGPGGMRDIEFLVQGLQLIHAHAHPEILEGSTLGALEALVAAGILGEATGAELAKDYVFLRELENSLQIYDDRQTHRLPRESERLMGLARRMVGPEAGVEDFEAELAALFERVRARYREFLAEVL